MRAAGRRWRNGLKGLWVSEGDLAVSVPSCTYELKPLIISESNVQGFLWAAQGFGTAFPARPAHRSFRAATSPRSTLKFRCIGGCCSQLPLHPACFPDVFRAAAGGGNVIREFKMVFTVLCSA